MVNLWGPGAFDSLNPSASRPTVTPANAPGDVDDWFKDCSSPLVADGTEWRSGLLNLLVANLRGVVRGSATPDSNLDDFLIAKAIQSGGMNYAIATGTANNWVVALNLALTSYRAGRVLWLRAPATNTSTTVVAVVDALAARPIRKADGSAPAIGDLVSGRWYPTIDDGTNICVLSTLPSDVITAGSIVGRTQVFLASGTFTVPAGVVKVRATVIGAGGAAGGSGNGAGGGVAGNAGAGGGGGGYSRKDISGLTPGATVAVTVGAGGVPVASATTPGGGGGTSSFGAYNSASGGGGGSAGNLTTGAGGSGGTGTGGDINITGGPGGFTGPNTTSPSVGGEQTIVWRGGMAAGGFSNLDLSGSGSAGKGYGSGGNGPTGGAGAFPGGAGAPGIVIVEW